ncbi:peptidyl-prolyl cis-trans isomerase, FKBP-type, partial [Ostertagia ostertagi]
QCDAVKLERAFLHFVLVRLPHLCNSPCDASFLPCLYFSDWFFVLSLKRRRSTNFKLALRKEQSHARSSRGKGMYCICTIPAHFSMELSSILAELVTKEFTFTLGMGQVIKGWDQGLLNMCVGERRILTIPAHMAYGERGSPPKIPANAPLKFDVELMKIDRKGEL